MFLKQISLRRPNAGLKSIKCPSDSPDMHEQGTSVAPKQKSLKLRLDHADHEFNLLVMKVGLIITQQKHYVIKLNFC